MTKFNVQASALSEALEKIRGATPQSTTIPILEHILFETSLGELRLTTSAIDAQSVATVPCETVGGYRRAVSPSVSSVCKLLGGKTLEFEATEGDRLEVKSGHSRFAFATLEASEFPVMAPLAGAENAFTFGIDAASLKMALDATRHVASADTKNSFYICGVNIVEHLGTLQFSATDRYRIARVQIPLPAGYAAPSVTIPTRIAGEISKLISGIDGDVSVSISNTAFEVGTPNASITSRLVGGAISRR